ncbi:MAG: hypothetical protein JXR95_02455 [Deltaproteobacteria bacterium]|nr:hypothetical protein [Deltaproteobacteria bacterium]
MSKLKKSSYGQLIQELETMCEFLNVDLKYEKIQSHHPRKSALFKIKGTWKLIIDRHTTVEEKYLLLLDNLALFDRETIFIQPALRDTLDRRQTELESLGKKLPGRENG